MSWPASTVAHLGVIALTGALAGCISPQDPLGHEPLPPSLNRRATNEVQKDRPPSPQVEGVSRTSASIPSPAAPSEPVVPPPPQTFAAESAIQFALQNNPMLHTVRQQRGFAQGGVVIARTYPFNPLLQVFELAANGPSAAGITNHVFSEATMRLDLEIRGQGRHRRSAANAVFTRTEWEIATQELLVSVATNRAFNTVLYRKRKLEVLEDTVKLNALVEDQVKKLVDLGRLRPADTLVARTELEAARAQLGQGKAALAVARADLRRQLGRVDDSFEVKGELDLPISTTDLEVHSKAALQLRPDLQARRVAVEEAHARLRLQVADRYGNPSIGPGFEFNETSAAFIGMWLVTPIPVLNTRRGEIMQAQATVARAILEVKQFEVQSEQDVQAALLRLAEARKWADSYVAEVLPSLRKATQDMNKLLQQNDPGVDVIKVIGVQRNYLRAFDAYLDALLEVSQARADLAAAVGDPALAIGLEVPGEKPVAPPLPAPKPLPVPPK